MDELDQRVKVAERKNELKAEETAEKAKTATEVSSAPFTIQSADGNFLLHLGADVQIDNRTFPGHSNVFLQDQILIRRARPIVSGTLYKYIDFYIRPDFGQGSVVLYEAYMQFNYFSRANLRVESSSRRSGSNGCNRTTTPILLSAACRRCWCRAAILAINSPATL